MVRRTSEIGDVRGREAEVGLRREAFQPRGPSVRPEGSVQAGAEPVRKQRRDLDSFHVQRDAERFDRLAESGFRVDGQREVAPGLQPRREGQRQDVPAAERVAEVVVEQDVFHDRDDLIFERRK